MNTIKILVTEDHNAWMKGDEILFPIDKAHEAVEAGWAKYIVGPRVKIAHVPPLTETKAVK